MPASLKAHLEKNPVETSAPCRVDMGGTLDLAIFYNPLRRLSPSTFNFAIDLRTTVRLLPYRSGRIKVSSKGFESAEYAANQAPFDHPLGLMFAIAAYFGAEGVHIVISSSSPPRSALGGSSAAAVALIAAFLAAAGQPALTSKSRKQIALLAHRIEESVAGVPCGRQDHLAAAFGGVNAWLWRPELKGFDYTRKALFGKTGRRAFRCHYLLAYCGAPHVSKDVNGVWVRQFLTGEHRSRWNEIVRLTKLFIDALLDSHYKEAAEAMNRETGLRRDMTPEVLDAMGVKLVEAAIGCSCGARFTGAGGGGCIWALGRSDDIDRLRPLWEKVLSGRSEACLLDADVDANGVMHFGGDSLSP